MKTFLTTVSAIAALAIPTVARARTPQVAALPDAHGALRVFHVEGGSLYRTDQVAPNAAWADAVLVATGVSAVTLATNADGRLEAFYLTGSEIFHTWQIAPAGAWSAPGFFAGPAVDVAVGRHEDGTLDVFYAGVDGGLRDIQQVAPSSTWKAAQWIASPATEVVTGLNADGRLEIFWSGGGSAPTSHRWEQSPNGAWSAPGAFASPGANLTLGTNADGRLEVFYVEKTSNTLNHKWQVAPSAGWSSGDALFTPPGIRASSSAAVGRNADGRLDVLYVDGYGNLGHAWQTAPNSAWTGFVQLGWQAQSIASANNADGRQELFYVTRRGALFHDWQLQPNRFWAGEYPLPNRQSSVVWMDALGPSLFVPPYGDWHVNDHTIARAPDGSYRLFGIFAPNPNVSTNLFDFHVWLGAASAPRLDGPWTNQNPPFFESAVTGTYRALWAPYVFPFKDGYAMVYCDGLGNDPEHFAIDVRFSLDLSTWTPPTTILKDGYQARDPMVIRLPTNEWVLYYTATESPDQGHHIVAYVTSPDLVNWSARGTAYTDFHWGADFGPTESPFVVQRGNYYYLFIGPRPYDAPNYSHVAPSDGINNWEHPGYVGTDVFRSTRWDHWENADYVAHLPVHAAEIVKDDAGRSWVTSGGIAQGGLKMARLYWGDGLGP